MSSNKPSADNPTAVFRCVARRHMGAEFRLYDAMLAIVMAAKDTTGWEPGEPLPTCYAKTATLANMIDRSMEQVRVMAAMLESAGWIVDLNAMERRRNMRGKYLTVNYRVLTHEEYAATYPDCCPALRYDPETGEPIKPGQLAPGLVRENVRRMIRVEEFPEEWLDAIADAIAARKTKSSTGNPV